MKKDSTFVRICLFIICLLLTAACVDNNNSQQTKIIDEEHKTFYVNGISAADGYEAVSNSLKNIGFTIDKDRESITDLPIKDGVQECDFTFIGKGFYYSANYYAKSLTNEQFSKLTYGLFDNLPSGFTLSELLEADKAEGLCDEHYRCCRIYLEWYKSGEIKMCEIQTYHDTAFPDVTEINKRLLALFPHSKIGGSYCYKTFYDDNGVEMKFIPELGTITIIKKELQQ